MNNHLNKKVVMERIASKVIARVDRMGFIQATGVHAVCRCGGKVIARGQSFRLGITRQDGVPLAN